MKRFLVEVTLKDGTSYGCQIGKISDTVQALLIYPNMGWAWKHVQEIRIIQNPQYKPELDSPQDRLTYP